MEWVETTAKTTAEAQELALDQLGVGADEAEFDVLEEPKSGLFGRVRGEARVRARVKPASVRPKQERRPRSKNGQRNGSEKASGSRSNGSGSNGASRSAAKVDTTDTTDTPDAVDSDDAPSAKRAGSKPPRQNKEHQRMDNDRPQSDVTPQEVGDAAASFMADLARAFGVDDASTELIVDGTDLDVRVTGAGLGLMVGPGGRTLNAIQDLVRVAAQRRLGDHETRLRVDIADYREKRRVALEQFAAKVAAQVIETGAAKRLEPMPSSDRKVVHDAIIEIDGVTSRSEGDDPMRRVVITPA
jgi:spoIIIJ-associated protein